MIEWMIQSAGLLSNLREVEDKIGNLKLFSDKFELFPNF